MGKITFISTAGKLPITAELIGSGLAPIIVYAHNTEYSFENVPLGDYTLLLTGDDGCYNSTEVVMSDYQGEWIEFECCTYQGEWVEYECVLSDYEGEWVESECFEITTTTTTTLLPTTTTTTLPPTTTTTTTLPPTTTSTTTLLSTTTTTTVFSTTTTTSSTIQETTTTTTTYEYYDFGEKKTILSTVNQGNCGQEELYPRATAFSIMRPDSIIDHYLELDYTQMEYIKITYTYSDAGVSLMYNGSEIQTNDIIYSGGSQYTWDNGDITLVAQSESESDLDVVLKYRIKAIGYNETVEGYHTCRWNGCKPTTTTTTTTIEPTTTTSTTTELVTTTTTTTS